MLRVLVAVSAPLQALPPVTSRVSYHQHHSSQPNSAATPSSFLPASATSLRPLTTASGRRSTPGSGTTGVNNNNSNSSALDGDVGVWAGEARDLRYLSTMLVRRKIEEILQQVGIEAEVTILSECTKKNLAFAVESLPSQDGFDIVILVIACDEDGNFLFEDGFGMADVVPPEALKACLSVQPELLILMGCNSQKGPPLVADYAISRSVLCLAPSPISPLSSPMDTLPSLVVFLRHFIEQEGNVTTAFERLRKELRQKEEEEEKKRVEVRKERLQRRQRRRLAAVNGENEGNDNNNDDDDDEIIGDVTRYHLPSNRCFLFLANPALYPPRLVSNVRKSETQIFFRGEKVEKCEEELDRILSKSDVSIFPHPCIEGLCGALVNLIDVIEKVGEHSHAILHGPSGQGMSTLASLFVIWMFERGHFRNLIFVDCSPTALETHRCRNQNSLLRILGSYFLIGLGPPSSAARPIDNLFEILNKEKCLIVFDNFDELSGKAQSGICEVLKRCGPCVKSIACVSHPTMEEWEPAPLALEMGGALCIRVQSLPLSEAERLLLRYIHKARRNDDLSEPMCEFPTDIYLGGFCKTFLVEREVKGEEEEEEEEVEEEDVDGKGVSVEEDTTTREDNHQQQQEQQQQQETAKLDALQVNDNSKKENSEEEGKVAAEEKGSEEPPPEPVRPKLPPFKPTTRWDAMKKSNRESAKRSAQAAEEKKKLQRYGSRYREMTVEEREGLRQVAIKLRGNCLALKLFASAAVDDVGSNLPFLIRSMPTLPPPGVEFCVWAGVVVAGSYSLTKFELEREENRLLGGEDDTPKKIIESVSNSKKTKTFQEKKSGLTDNDKLILTWMSRCVQIPHVDLLAIFIDRDSTYTISATRNLNRIGLLQVGKVKGMDGGVRMSKSIKNCITSIVLANEDQRMRGSDWVDAFERFDWNTQNLRGIDVLQQMPGSFSILQYTLFLRSQVSLMSILPPKPPMLLSPSFLFPPTIKRKEKKQQHQQLRNTANDQQDSNENNALKTIAQREQEKKERKIAEMTDEEKLVSLLVKSARVFFWGWERGGVPPPSSLEGGLFTSPNVCLRPPPPLLSQILECFSPLARVLNDSNKQIEAADLISKFMFSQGDYKACEVATKLANKIRTKPVAALPPPM